MSLHKMLMIRSASIFDNNSRKASLIKCQMTEHLLLNFSSFLDMKIPKGWKITCMQQTLSTCQYSLQLKTELYLPYIVP